jgi:molybdate transport system ATP-binding protein
MLDVSITRRQGTFLLDAAFATEHRRIVLFGPSGAGKTLTLQCLAGFLAPDRGRIAVDGTVLFDSGRSGRGRAVNVPPWRRRVGVVLQAYTLLPHLTVGENVAYGLGPVWRGLELVRVETLLAAVGLAGYAQRMPAQLSGGQRQRVALAQALASDPRLLLLDEPFSAVDAPVRERLRRDLLVLLDAFRVPLVFVTHDFGEAWLLGQTVVLLSKGRVVQVGAPHEVGARPRTATVARLVGATNILDATVVDVADGTMVLRAGDLLFRASPPERPLGGAAQAPAAGDVVPVCLRPEHIRLVSAGPGVAAATVTRVLPRNGSTTVLLSAGDLVIEASVPGTPPAVGTRIGVHVNESAAHVLERRDDETAE